MLFWVLRGVEIQKPKYGAIATGCLLGGVYLSDWQLKAKLLGEAEFQRAGVTSKYTA